MNACYECSYYGALTYQAILQHSCYGLLPLKSVSYVYNTDIKIIILQDFPERS